MTSRGALFIALALAPVLALLALYVLAGPLAPGTAALAGLPCLVACGVLARLAQRHLQRIAGLVQEPGTPGAPADPVRSWLFPDLAATLRRKNDAWAGERLRLTRQAAFTEEIFRNLPYPLILIDGRRRIVHLTAGAADLLGAAVPGADLASVLRDPGVLAAADRVLADGEREIVEYEYLSASPTVLSVQMERVPAATRDEPAAVIAIRDVTEIKRIHQARADFVADASHELRTPLSVLAAGFQTLLGPARDDPESQRRFIATMAGHVTRMTRLTRDLLSLSRIEMHEKTPPDGVVDLPEALSEVAQSLRLPASERGIDIEVDAAAVPAIRGDGDEIAELFQNLVDNAVKYSADGSVVRVVARDCARKADGEAAVEVSVIDRGPGIAEEHRPRLTERFYRVDDARSRELGGTGLGLAIVKHIVNRHRGTLDLDSEVGRGSTFTVRLPAADR